MIVFNKPNSHYIDCGNNNFPNWATNGELTSTDNTVTATWHYAGWTGSYNKYRVLDVSGSNPRAEGLWKGDYLLIHNGNPGPWNLSFTCRISSAGLRYWVMYYMLDGNMVYPIETSTATDSTGTFSYNIDLYPGGSADDYNKTITASIPDGVDSVYIKCASNIIASTGKEFTAPNSASWRLDDPGVTVSGESGAASVKFVSVAGVPAKKVYHNGVQVWPAEEPVPPTPKEYEWVKKTWTSMPEDMRGSMVWNDGSRVYYDRDWVKYPNTLMPDHYELINGSWERTSWVSGVFVSGNDIWTDLSGTIHYSGNSIISSDMRYEWCSYKMSYNYWTAEYVHQGLSGRNIWKDNEGHLYYNGMSSWQSGEPISVEFVNGQWVQKGWNTDIYVGAWIWTDNAGHIYYSFRDESGEEETMQYELVNGAWVEKDWGAWSPLDGENIWKDNEGRVYYSSGSTQYELVNGVWVEKDWGIRFNGVNVWHDSEGHYYYSYYDDQYELVEA